LAYKEVFHTKVVVLFMTYSSSECHRPGSIGSLVVTIIQKAKYDFL